MEKAENNILAKRIVYYILGSIEILLAFRFILKLLGANPQSWFVSFVYTLTSIFLAPFYGVFSPFITNGIETRSVLEPANIIGMVVYAVLAWGIVRLIEIKANREQ